MDPFAFSVAALAGRAAAVVAAVAAAAHSPAHSRASTVPGMSFTASSLRDGVQDARSTAPSKGPLEPWHGCVSESRERYRSLTPVSTTFSTDAANAPAGAGIGAKAAPWGRAG